MGPGKIGTLNKIAGWTLIFCLQIICHPTLSFTPQIFKLYSDNHIESFQTSFENLDQVTILSKQSESDFFCSERGAWIGFNSYGFVNNPSTSFNSKLFKESVLPSCRHLPDANGRTISQFKRLMSVSKLGSIRHIGHVDAGTSALSLYEMTHFGGAELYFDGTTLRLPRPVRVKSYGFTGNESWTLFENFDLNGSSRLCLDGQTLKNTMIDSVTVEGDVDFLKVGSLQRGCSNLESASPGSENSLTLHSAGNKSLLFIDGSEVRLPFAQSFRSFSLNGLESWTVYEGIKLNGPSQCLSLPKQTTDAVGSTQIHESEFSENYLHLHKIYTSTHQTFHENLMIGAVKRGCVPNFLRQSRFNVFSDANAELSPGLQRQIIIGLVPLIFQNFRIFN